VTEPIHIGQAILFTDAALAKLLHLPASTIKTLKKNGRIRPAEISNVDVYLDEEVVAYFRRRTEEVAAELAAKQAKSQSAPPDSSAA